MLKRGIGFLLMAMMILSLWGCGNIVKGGLLDDRADKEKIIEFVCENEGKLLNAIENGDFASFEKRGFINEISDNGEIVDFSCGGAGFGPSTSYVGFYYTSDHNMRAIWCSPPDEEGLIPRGEGFEWWEENGDNYYYTEHICGNFYYYEASF